MNLFNKGEFVLHSGGRSDFKIDCDALTDGDWEALAAAIAGKSRPFFAAVGVPSGGLKLASALRKHATEGAASLLIVDDVLTTGASMTLMRRECPLHGDMDIQGFVVFARGPMPQWVRALFVT
jgi:orotate phosphoribosyltransferase